MTVVPIDVRPPRPSEAAALADLQREAWRYAYRGIIPGLELERLVARRGRAWWRHRLRAGLRTLVLDFDGTVAGYVTFGPSRARRMGATGEIYELYLRPEFHGAGLGRRLFQAAREQLSRCGLTGLVVWSLAENDVGRRFYTALGGRERARSVEITDGAVLPMVAFVWP